MSPSAPLALVTGASSGIGRELAIQCVQHGFDLLIAADEPEIEFVADELRALAPVNVATIQTDLSKLEGVDELYDALAGRPVDALLANVGTGVGGAFLDQSFDDVLRVIDTNVTGTVYLLHKVGRDMRARNAGRILITGSIAGHIPGTFMAVYNSTKAFVDLFAEALRAELKETDVSVTCLLPGATETEFFERADMLDTKVGQAEKDDPADVARAGFEAMMKGDGHVVTGWKNKLHYALSGVTPASYRAEQQRKMSEPGSAYE